MCANVMSPRFEKETTEAMSQLILDTDHVSDWTAHYHVTANYHVTAHYHVTASALQFDSELPCDSALWCECILIHEITSVPSLLVGEVHGEGDDAVNRLSLHPSAAAHLSLVSLWTCVTLVRD